MASLACVACVGSKTEDVGTLFKRSTISANNGIIAAVLGTREEQSFDPYRLGLIVDGAKYRQTYAIRISDVGPNKTATMESIVNLFQETKSNQLRLTGLTNGDGFGTTNEMMRNGLIWVLTRMQVEVDHYPVWGDIVDIDTWFVESKGLGIRRDWIIRCHNTGLTLARGTSIWVMMNHETRRLVRISNALKDELSPWFVNNEVINHANEKIEKLGVNTAIYANSDVKPKRSDLDMNNHVNNVKFLRWMLETIPDQFVETHQLSSIVLEYKNECKSSDLIESLVGPNEDGIVSHENGHLRYTHLLHTNGENKTEEIARGKTTWKKKPSFFPIPNLNQEVLPYI